MWRPSCVGVCNPARVWSTNNHARARLPTREGPAPCHTDKPRVSCVVACRTPDVLEVQQSRDGHDAAYVCRGGVVLTRGQQLRATAPTLTVDARTHEASSGPPVMPPCDAPAGWYYSGPKTMMVTPTASIVRLSRAPARL